MPYFTVAPKQSPRDAKRLDRYPPYSFRCFHVSSFLFLFFFFFFPSAFEEPRDIERAYANGSAAGVRDVNARKLNACGSLSWREWHARWPGIEGEKLARLTGASIVFFFSTSLENSAHPCD